LSGTLAVDRASLGYAALATAVTLWRWPSEGRSLGPVLLVYAVLAAVALLAPRLRRGGAVARFVGEFYPLLLTVALYTAIGVLNRAAGTSHDASVQRWEAAVFRGQPAHDCIRAQPWPSLSATLHVGYLSYYAILASAPLGPWLRGDLGGARRTVLAMTSAFYACYLVFLTFPVAGPHYSFPPARNAATAVAPAQLTYRLLDAGAAWGTAFPSSHVAVSLVAAACALRFRRGLGLALAGLAVLLTLGTVYGQFHYALDALAGALVAVAVLALQGLFARGNMTGPSAGA
jgi:membrane-associated phospholipid phosphatase